MTKLRSLILSSFLLILLLTAACQGAPEGPTVASPEAAKTTVRGRVMTQGQPLVDVAVRLAEVHREADNPDEGAYVLDGAFSPGARTDGEGYFVMENIEPIEYVLVVGDVYGIYTVVANSDGRPKVWQTQAGQVVDFGVVNVTLGQ